MFSVKQAGPPSTGTNQKHFPISLDFDVIKNIYGKMPDPKVVVAIGICALSGNVFKDCYNVLGGIDTVIPVDVYVPGCAARPEAIIDGVVQALSILEAKKKKNRMAINTAATTQG